MTHRYKKFLSLLLSVALINSSIQPLYASFPEHEDDVVRKAGAQARLDMLEEALQNKIKSSATVIENWTPSFIKKAAAKLGNWFESTFKDLPPAYFTKSPLETDYIHNRAFWLAHFSSALDDIGDGGYSNSALNARLVELQDMVFTGVLSPYVYEKGLEEIDESDLGNQSIFKNTREEFRKALKTAPGFIDQTFRHEASLYMRDMQEGKGDVQEFISHIRYYRDIDNALDHKDTLTTIRSYLREHKKTLKITQKDYDNIIATINKAIGATAKDEKKRLKVNQAFSMAASSVLPYYNQEWVEIHQHTNNSLAESSKGKGIIADYLDTSTKALRKLVHTGAKYAQEHPTQALMMALAGQVAAAAALKSFTGIEAIKGVNKQAKTQEISLREEAVEQKLSSAHSSVSLLHRAAKRNIGDEFQINQNNCPLNGSPSIASLTNGDVFVAWQGCPTQLMDFYGYSIYGRLYSSNGTSLNNEFGLNQNMTSNHEQPFVTALSNGNVFVTWSGDQTGDYNIYGRIISANGTALSPEFSISQNTTSDQPYSSVAAQINGNIFVAWQGGQTGQHDIYGRLFSSNGTSLNSEFSINQNTTSDQFLSSVAALATGNVFVAWNGFQTGNYDYDIYGCIFSANGTALNPEFGISQVTSNNQLVPSVATLLDDNVFVVWKSDQTENYDIYGRLYSLNGTALTNEFGINQNTTSDQSGPSVAALSNSNVFVAWYGRQAGNYDIYGRLFSSSGTALSPEFSINQATTNDQYGPSVAALPNGNVFVAWYGNQAGSYDIYGRVFTNETLASLIVPSTTGTSAGISTSASSTTGPQTTGMQTTGITSTTNDLSTGTMSTTEDITSSSLSSSSSSAASLSGTTIAPTASSLASTAALPTTGTTKVNTGATLTATSSSMTTAPLGTTGRGSVTIMVTTSLPTTSMSASSSITRAATSTLTGKLTTTKPSSNAHEIKSSQDENSSTTLAIGLGVGIGVPVIAAGVGFALYKKRQYNKEADSGSSEIEMGSKGQFSTEKVADHQNQEQEAIAIKNIAREETRLRAEEEAQKEEAKPKEEARLEQERLEKEAAEKQRLEEERIKIETEKLRFEQERLKQETEKFRLEQDRLKKEADEKQRLEEERIKIETEKLRLEQERLKQETEKLRLEQDRLKKEAEENKSSGSFKNAVTSDNRDHTLEEVLKSFKTLRSLHPDLQSLSDIEPTAIMIYAWGVKQNEEKVHTLAQHLKDAGINILLDIWHNTPGTNTMKFSQNILNPKTDFIVVCGSKKLMEKLDEKNENNSVVRAEIEMIGERATWANNKKGIIPILLEGTHRDVLPSFLWNTVSIGFQNPDTYKDNCESLLRTLYKLKTDDPYLKALLNN